MSTMADLSFFCTASAHSECDGKTFIRFGTCACFCHLGITAPGPQPVSKNEASQESLRLAQHVLQTCVSVYGPLDPEQTTGMVQMMQREMMQRMTFEELQTYFVLLQALKLVNSITSGSSTR